jgi:methylmalonyl-CoA/ethylmalonyl-CoA epimerase
MSELMLPTDVTPARVAHVGIAVRDIEKALAFYRDVLGLEPLAPEHEDGATIISLPCGGPSVELLHSADESTPVGKYLSRHGPGIHHICLQVADLDAALARCREAGYALVDEVPRSGAHGHRIAFLHPRGTSGILIELSD